MVIIQLVVSLWMQRGSVYLQARFYCQWQTSSKIPVRRVWSEDNTPARITLSSDEDYHATMAVLASNRKDWSESTIKTLMFLIDYTVVFLFHIFSYLLQFYVPIDFLEPPYYNHTTILDYIVYRYPKYYNVTKTVI